MGWGYGGGVYGSKIGLFDEEGVYWQATTGGSDTGIIMWYNIDGILTVSASIRRQLGYSIRSQRMGKPI